MNDISFFSKSFFDDIADHPDKHVHLVLIATKPDIIKQIPLYRELKKRGRCVILGHTGQHYDMNLSGGMLAEFGVEPDFNLHVRGSMDEVVSQIIGRLGHIIGEMKKHGKIVIPYVHGDTTTAMAGAIAGYCHMFASVHVEAGIRTLTPCYTGDFALSGWGADIDAWRAYLMERKNWERGSLEPYPEQFNTRTAETATGIHLAPVSLDRDFMLGEGFPEERIVVVGNSVVDALDEVREGQRTEDRGRSGTKRRAQSKERRATRVGRTEGLGQRTDGPKANNAEQRVESTELRATIFEKYPLLGKGDFVRFCIHRRENCVSEKRFRAIYDAMKSLILDGRTVLLISMNQTKAALRQFGLESDLLQLAAHHPHFILSDVWPEYGDVIEVMQRAAVCATDSGSMQEEMNILGVPCVTLRFGSDRSESAMAGGNLIAPPVDAPPIKAIIEYAWDNQEMRSAPKLYGEHVSEKCIDAVESVLTDGEVFRTEEERLIR